MRWIPFSAERDICQIETCGRIVSRDFKSKVDVTHQGKAPQVERCFVASIDTRGNYDYDQQAFSSPLAEVCFSEVRPEVIYKD